MIAQNFPLMLSIAFLHDQTLALLDDCNSHILTFLIVFSCATVATKSPPVDYPDRILDPPDSTSYGKIHSPQRMILKLGCPDCPVYYNSLLKTNATTSVSPPATIYTLRY